MALAPDDIIRCTWRASALSQEFQFQQTFRVLTTDGGTGTLASLFGIASYLTGDVTYGGPALRTTTWLNMLPTGVTLYACDVQRLTPNKTIYIRKETSQTGTGGTGPKQTNTCSVFSLVSALPGRKQIAKYHVGPLPDAYAANGGLTTTALTALRALASACVPIMTLTLAIAGDTTLQPVIFHRNPNSVPRFNDVATYRFNFWIRTQRRRTIAVGK